MNACRFKHTGIALRLLERAIALDPDLGRRIDRWQGRQAFVDFLIQHPGSHWSGGPTEGREKTPWEAFVIRQLTSALDDDDLAGVPPLAGGRTVGAPAVVRARAGWADRAGQLREEPGTVHRGAAGVRSGATPDRASTAVVGHRLGARLRKCAPPSAADAHLAAARRPAACGGHRECRRGGALVRRNRPARSGDRWRTIIPAAIRTSRPPTWVGDQ